MRFHLYKLSKLQNYRNKEQNNTQQRLGCWDSGMREYLSMKELHKVDLCDRGRVLCLNGGRG